VSVARDGEEGLTAIRTQRPDLVILDVMMPGSMGSRPVCGAGGPGVGRRPHPDAHAKGREAEQKKGLGLGADAYMPKPFSTHELVAKAKQLLASPA